MSKKKKHLDDRRIRRDKRRQKATDWYTVKTYNEDEKEPKDGNRERQANW
jgi:hypothetical protein